MADDIQLKRSAVPGLVPDSEELLDGELAVNTADERIYAKNAQGQVVALNPSPPVQSIASSSESLTVTEVGGDFTLGLVIEPTPQQQADWADGDAASVAFIKNKPTALSAFANDEGYVDATGAAAAAPIQSIVSPDSSVGVSAQPGGVIQITVAPPPTQLQADWLQQNSGATDFIRNKPTGLSAFANDASYVNASQAAAAAPVQSIAAGANVSVTASNGAYTIAASIGDYVRSVSGVSPIVLSGTSDVTVSVAEATESSVGVVQLASAADIAAGANGRVVDAEQLKGAVPTALSQLANDQGFATEAAISQAVAGYLPLSGGTISGDLLVAPGGSARAPTPSAGDSSTLLATTEWVSRELAAVGATEYRWTHGGADAQENPTPGYLRISADGAFIAFHKYTLDGLVSAAGSLASGDLIFVTKAPLAVSNLTTEGGDTLTSEFGFSIILEQ